MSKDQPFVFGYRPQCCRCKHRSDVGVLQGHPNACHAVRWVGDTHVSPTLRDDDCSDYTPAGRPAETTLT